MLIDHFFQNIFFPARSRTLLTWLAANARGRTSSSTIRFCSAPWRPGRAGQPGVGVTELIRRHPVVIGEAMMTLSHLTKRAPILGVAQAVG